MLVSFKELYNSKLFDSLKKDLGYKSDYLVPKISKIVINMGVGESVSDSKVINHALSDLQSISGQKPIVTYAKKSEAAFKLRDGMKIGCKVTLRKNRMYEFLDKLVRIAMPRIKDFKGLSSKSFDGRGNITFGIKEQIIFPEIEYDKIDSIRGMDITIVTTSNNNSDAKKLLSSFYIPFYN
ncbi:MAG TPA: 50S ribosomal protein L5 [Candidatus Megaira endosymbiont of Hartmannula sinica]|nr:50S ribosomal protein L5 [Candidatus Megaera endosymbiont of Hartmannula sinica]